MFTGIITDIGTVRSISHKGDTHITIETHYAVEDIAIGASIACNGICLTVVDKDKDWFAVNVSDETLRRTTVGEWKEGTSINLERALKLGDELGGHLVSGHVDGVGIITSITPERDSQVFMVEAPAELSRFLAEKGSVTLDGVSLTVNHVEESQFLVNIIPHTLAATALGRKSAGDKIHIEVDMLARYVARLLQEKA